MKRPHPFVTKPFLLATLVVCAFTFSFGVKGKLYAQQQQPPATTTTSTERERGVQLYKQGDIKGAVKALNEAVKKDKNDAEAWYYLSLALNRDEDIKGARKAAEKSVKLRPTFAPTRAGLAYLLLLSNKLNEALREAEAALALDSQNVEASYVVSVVRFRRNDPVQALEAIETSLKYKPDLQAALLLKSQVLLALYAKRTDFVENESAETRAQKLKGATNLLKDAADSLEKYFQLNPSPPEADVWRAQLASLRIFSQNTKEADPADRTVYLPGELTTKARIISRPEPQYTDEAREAGVSGTVVMRAVFASDGTIQNILVLRSLPHGLTEMAVKAARQIKFIPATKDGRPVSQFIQIEYNFRIG